MNTLGKRTTSESDYATNESNGRVSEEEGIFMSLANINPRPRFTQQLVARRIFAQEPLVVVDIGARGGFEQLWSAYGDQVKLVGFEADARECDRLNQQEFGAAKRFFPVALHRDKALRRFHVTAFPPSCGFYPADMRFVRRFPDEINLRVVKTVEMDTVDFDTYAAGSHIDGVDFIKLDTEGSELDILKGAIATLRRTVIGLSVEAEFLQWHVDQPVLSDVDLFLRPLGFRLYDIAIYRHTRKSLPVVPPWAIPGSTARGQVIWGQALYLRDGVDEIEHSSLLECGWDNVKILKLASLMEMFYLHDCAIELIQSARRKEYLRIDEVDHFIDLLVPTLSGDREVSYQEYLDSLSQGKEVSYQEQLESLGLSKHAGTLDKMQYAKKFVPRPFRHIIGYCLVKVRDSINEVL